MKKMLLFVLIPWILSCHISEDKKWLSSISNLPSFDMLLMDNTTLLHAKDIPVGKPILMIYFRPDCPHCKKETKGIIDRISDFRDCQIFFVTGASTADARQYAQYFHLDQCSNIIVAKDNDRTFKNAFHPEFIPYMAMYNKEKKLIRICHGEIPISSVITEIHS